VESGELFQFRRFAAADEMINFNEFIQIRPMNDHTGTE